MKHFISGVAGSASYTVFSTDYENYAGIFTCQKIAFSNRQSVSILSREKTLDKMYLDKVNKNINITTTLAYIIFYIVRPQNIL